MATPRPSSAVDRKLTAFRDDMLASLEGLERDLARLRRRTLAVGLCLVAVTAADLAAILAARP